MKRYRKIGVIILCLTFLVSAMQKTEVYAATTAIPTIVISVGKGQKTPEYTEEKTDQVLSVLVENQGTESAKNVKVTPVINDAGAWPFDITDMNYEREISGEIPAGGNAPATWEGLRVRTGVGTQNYKLEFLITYDDGVNTYAANKQVFVKTIEKEKPAPEPEPDTTPSPELFGGGVVNNDAVIAGGGNQSGTSSVPRVIVTGFSTEPGEVPAGSNFKLIVHLKNTSSQTAVSNMLFDFQAPSSGTEGAAEAPAFLPSSGSSTVYLERIGAGGTQDIAIDLNARADLVQKPYSIVLSMKYEGADAAQFEGNSSLAIPVKQAARFEFSDFEIAPDVVAIGDETSITCSLYNTGRVKLYNVKVKFQGDGIESKDVFVGNVDSGATGTIDGIITATEETKPEQKFKMVVSYEDNAGQVATAEKEFSLQITAQQETMDMSMAVEMPEENTPPRILIVVGSVAVLIGIVVLLFVLRKRKKQRETGEEEGLLDEVDRFTEDE